MKRGISKAYITVSLKVNNMQRLIVLVLCVILSGCLGPEVKQPEKVVEVDKSSYGRGQLLYENHCQVCHDSRAHIRENHKARSPADVEMWVKRWSTYLKLNWKQAEIEDVRTFLSDRYYKFGQGNN